MKLQKQYLINKEGRKVDYVDVIHTGICREQNFARRLVEDAVADGWMSIDGDVLIIKAQPEELVYKILRDPGYYCKSTQEKIPISHRAWVRILSTGKGDLSKKEAVLWLTKNQKPASDYEIITSYECILDEVLHEKYKAVRDLAGNVVAQSKIGG